MKAAVELVPGNEASEALEAELVARDARAPREGYRLQSVDFETSSPSTPRASSTSLLRDRYWKDGAIDLTAAGPFATRPSPRRDSGPWWPLSSVPIRPLCLARVFPSERPIAAHGPRFEPICQRRLPRSCF